VAARHFLGRAFALLLVAAPVAAQSRPAGDVLTLDAAIAAALEHNRQLQAARLSVDMAAAAVANAKASRLPIIDVSSTAAQSVTEMAFTFPRGAFGAFDGTGPVPAENVKVTSPRRPLVLAQATVSQPLTQLHRLNLGVKASETALAIEEERYRGSREQVVASVRQTYYALVNADRAIAAAERTLDTSRELTEVILQRVSQRVVLRADGLDAQYRVAQAEQARRSLIHSRESLEQQMNHLLGRDIGTPFTLAAIAPASGVQGDLDLATRQAMERRHDIREARLQVERATLDRRAKSAEATPDVSLSFSYQSVFNVDVLPRNYTTVGVQVGWEPWDWGRRRREVGQKVNAEHQARLALKEREATAVREIADRYRRLQDARAQLEVAVLGEELARERTRVRAEQIKVAAVLPVDGLAAQTELIQAGARHQEALSAYWTARAQYELAIGEDVR
jgi:outer membrane protein TolC